MTSDFFDNLDISPDPIQDPVDAMIHGMFQQYYSGFQPVRIEKDKTGKLIVAIVPQSIIMTPMFMNRMMELQQSIQSFSKDISIGYKAVDRLDEHIIPQGQSLNYQILYEDFSNLKTILAHHKVGGSYNPNIHASFAFTIDGQQESYIHSKNALLWPGKSIKNKSKSFLKDLGVLFLIFQKVNGLLLNAFNEAANLKVDHKFTHDRVYELNMTDYKTRVSSFLNS